MNRRQLVFILFVNALLSLVIALAVVWAVEQRRPDTEALSAFALLTPVSNNTVPALSAENSENSIVSNNTDGNVASNPIDSNEENITDISTPQAQVHNQAQPATPLPPTATPIPDDLEIYIVQGGDSLGAIAERFEVSLQGLMELNQLSNPDFVFSGQRLVVPVPKDGAIRQQSANPESAAEPTAIVPTVQPSVEIASVENPGVLDQENILIINQGDQPVNLNGWTLNREGGPSYTFGSLPLFAGSGVRVYSGTGINSSVALYWEQSDSLWATGIVMTLKDTEGQDRFRYVVP